MLSLRIWARFPWPRPSMNQPVLSRGILRWWRMTLCWIEQSRPLALIQVNKFRTTQRVSGLVNDCHIALCLEWQLTARTGSEWQRYSIQSLGRLTSMSQINSGISLSKSFIIPRLLPTHSKEMGTLATDLSHWSLLGRSIMVEDLLFSTSQEPGTLASLSTATSYRYQSNKSWPTI